MFKNVLTLSKFNGRNALRSISTRDFSMILNKIPKKYFSATSQPVNPNNVKEIKINPKELKYFYPIKGLPQFANGLHTVFEYTPEPSKTDEDGEYTRLPQVPYEIKEHALKGFYYTFFLVWVGRLISNFALPYSMAFTHSYPLIPLSVFSYQYLSSLWYMSNAVTAIRLKEDGLKVIFEFKHFRKNFEVEIWRLKKENPETFFNECYAEPFLYPLTIDYTDVYGEYSLRSKQKVYLYGDSYKCIKDGEIFRAILNSESIQLK